MAPLAGAQHALACHMREAGRLADSPDVHDRLVVKLHRLQNTSNMLRHLLGAIPL